MFGYLILFTYNLFFNLIFLRRLLNVNNEVSKNNINNLLQDFSRIQFPVDIVFTNLFFSIIISSILTLLLFNLVINSLDRENIVNLLNVFIRVLFIYMGVIFICFYLFRFFNLSRLYILLFVLIFSFLTTAFIWLFDFTKFQKLYLLKKLIVITPIFLLVTIYFFGNESEQERLSVSEITTTTTSNPNDKFLTYSEDNECLPWSGSENLVGCIPGLTINVFEIFSESLNNLEVFNGDLYILTTGGIVYKNTKDLIFLDLSFEVMSRETEYPVKFENAQSESGLYAIAFHPSGNYFYVSYSDMDNNLVVESFDVVNELPNIESRKIVFTIPNSQCCHYGGTLIYSDYFDDFILGIGDMESNLAPYFNSEPLDTTSAKGKIIFLNKKNSQPPLLSDSAIYPPRNDLLAIGLRNPWNMIEYDQKLFIPDIGNITQEELNIVDLKIFNDNSKPFLFGWPHYEGNVDNEIIFSEIYHWEEGKAKKLSPYVDENSLSPAVYYNHVAPENYRAAIIGGVIIKNSESKYYEMYIYGDYTSSELFIYDYKLNELFLVPFPKDFYTNVTSVNINPFKNDSLLISTLDGKIIEANLP